MHAKQAETSREDRGTGRGFLVAVAVMMLAFAVDQAQQLACSLFQAAWHKVGSRCGLWERMRALFYTLPFTTLADIWRAIAFGFHIQGQVIIHDTS